MRFFSLAALAAGVAGIVVVVPSLCARAAPAASAASAPVAASADTLLTRFPAPPGTVRVDLDAGSFGASLRALSLASPGTPVTSFRGDVIRVGDDEHVAAVATLDVSPADLQQCADSVIRLHAEWLWSRGRRDATYFAASGAPMPFARWARGERPSVNASHGGSLEWHASRAPALPDDHAAYRQWLESVFTYANTVSLAKHAANVEPWDLRPGDFFVHPGWPGHVVLVLDVARTPGDINAPFHVLLGQGFMPAQSFHVLRPSRASAWFVLNPRDPKAPIETPFWPAFAWSELRRFF